MTTNSIPQDPRFGLGDNKLVSKSNYKRTYIEDKRFILASLELALSLHVYVFYYMLLDFLF